MSGASAIASTIQDAVLIEDTWNPEFEACRALVARGVTGRLEVWRAGKPGKPNGNCSVGQGSRLLDMIVPDIARAAGRTVVENEKIGPVMAPWRAWPEDMQPDGVSRDTVFRRGRFTRGGSLNHPRARSQRTSYPGRTAGRLRQEHQRWREGRSLP